MLKNEFWKFISWLDEKNSLDDYEKRIISLIYNNFNEILNTNNRGKEQNNRWNYIVKLILENLEDQIFVLPEIQETNFGIKEQESWVILKQLKLSYFRWFKEETTFDFHEKFNFIYWYNWTWKSSFSEALEYKLTWFIKEANHRGYRNDIDKYIKYVHQSWQTSIELIDTTWGDILENIDKYRFALVEKSRIDDFVRHKNNGASDSIENLFWLWDFANFIKDFNNDIDGKLTKHNEKEIKLLLEKKNHLDNIETLRIKIEEEKEEIKELFNAYQLWAIDDTGIQNFISDSEDKIKQKKQYIQEQNQEKIKQREGFEIRIKDIEESNGKVSKKVWWIIWFSIFIALILVSIFQNLFTLLLIPLSFLSFLFIKKEDTKDLESKLFEVWENLKEEIIDLVNNKIIWFRKDFDDLNNKEKALASFNKDNEIDLKRAEENKSKKEILENYEKWYKNIYKKLLNYKDVISEWFIKENLEKYTIEIFNELSKNRTNEIILTSIKIPKVDWEKLAVIDKDWKAINALQIFSEWNLRCLGLSILLSKAIVDNLDFIICDDITNAVDDDFRSQIIRLLVENKYFTNKQLIISSHSQDFIKLFAEKVWNKQYVQYTLNPTNLRYITKFQEESDIISQIESDLSRSRKSEWLTNCRKSLEKSIRKMSEKIVDSFIKIQSYSNFTPNTAQKLNAIIKHLWEKNKTDWKYDKLIEELNKILPYTIFYKFLNAEAHAWEKSLGEITSTEANEIFEIIKTLNNFQNLINN